MAKQVHNIEASFCTTATGVTSTNGIDDDEEEQLIEMLALGVRALSDVRDLCLQSNQNFRIATKFQKKADRVQGEAERYKHRNLLRNEGYSLDGSIARIKENYHRQRGFRCERSAQNHRRIAHKELKTAYSIINNNYNYKKDAAIETVQTTIDDYARAFRFLRKRYHRPMIHVGAGLLPSFKNTQRGDESKESNTYLGQIISGRQAKLLTAVIAHIEEDLMNSEITVTKRGCLQHASIPSCVVSFRSFHRGNGIYGVGQLKL